MCVIDSQVKIITKQVYYVSLQFALSLGSWTMCTLLMASLLCECCQSETLAVMRWLSNVESDYSYLGLLPTWLNLLSLLHLSLFFQRKAYKSFSTVVYPRHSWYLVIFSKSYLHFFCKIISPTIVCILYFFLGHWMIECFLFLLCTVSMRKFKLKEE